MSVPPKNPATRQRRNRTSTAARLSRDHDVTTPDLPEREPGWHRMTEAWWEDIWASPMATEFDQSDVHGLYLLAALVDEFWVKPSQALAAEIRLQRQCFGLSPIDRRRLQWEIERTDEAQDRGRKRRASAPKPPEPGADPRQVLRAVQ